VFIDWGSKRGMHLLGKENAHYAMSCQCYEYSRNFLLAPANKQPTSCEHTDFVSQLPEFHQLFVNQSQ